MLLNVVVSGCCRIAHLTAIVGVWYWWWEAKLREIRLDGESSVRRLKVCAPGVREWTLDCILHVIYGDSEVLTVEKIMPDLCLAKLGVIHRLHEKAICDIFRFVV